jgi:hypothetical protein
MYDQSRQSRQALRCIDNVLFGTGGLCDPIGNGEHTESPGRCYELTRRADLHTHFAAASGGVIDLESKPAALA